MESLKYWVWLSRIENLTKRKLDKLLERYKSVEHIWNIRRKKELLSLGITEALADKIVGEEYRKDLEKYIAYMQKNQIELLTFDDKFYPKRLKEIYDPPVSIYIKGNKEILSKQGIAIIGCRECTKYGENVAKQFAYNLSKANINIISGLAKRNRCIFAHRCTLCKRKDYWSNRLRIRYNLS